MNEDMYCSVHGCDENDNQMKNNFRNNMDYNSYNKMENNYNMNNMVNASCIHYKYYFPNKKDHHDVPIVICIYYHSIM